MAALLKAPVKEDNYQSTYLKVKVVDVSSSSFKIYEWELNISESLSLYKVVLSHLKDSKGVILDNLYLWHDDENVDDNPISGYERNNEGKIELIAVTKPKFMCKIIFQNKQEYSLPIDDFKSNDTLGDSFLILKDFGLQLDKITILMEDTEFMHEQTIVDTPFYKGFTIEYDDEPPREYKMIMMQNTIGRPSDYGKDPKETKRRKEKLQKEGAPICDHRGGNIGDDVTLYYPGFQKFIEESNDTSIPLEREDYQFAKRMCTEMSKYFDDEKKRQDKFKDILISEFEKEVNDHKMYNADISIGTECYVFIEVKNESGDSYAQVIAYYVKSLKKKNPYDCPAPGYLLELVGPHLFISGAVFGKYVFVDRLVDPVWLVPHQNEEATTRIARILKALKDAIREIQRYYKKPNKISKPEYPIFRSFNKGRRRCSIEYKERIKRHMFKGRLKYKEDEKWVKFDVIIKFTKRYCYKAHDLMYEKGCAPKLIHYQERVGGTQYTAVVVEYIDKIMHLDKYLEEYPNNKRKSKRFQEHLKVLHDHGFCHGKLTSNNIFMEFVSGKDRINIVNYEWAGRIGEARYPFSADIPDGIEPGDLISKARDRAQLDKFFDSTDSR